eukprot:352312-Chlamydomonas_euryale.AAC.8
MAEAASNGTPTTVNPGAQIPSRTRPAPPFRDAAASLSASNSTQPLPLYYLSRNCTALSAIDRRAIEQLGCATRLALGVGIECATVAPTW